MKFLSLIPLLLLLTSCFSKPSSSAAITDIPPVITPITTDSGQALISEQKQHDLDAINAIKGIKTLEELGEKYPLVLSNPKRDHPKFIELEKKRILLGMEAGKIPAERAQQLEKHLYDIQQGIEIWPETLNKLEGEYKNAVETAKGKLTDPRIRKASEKKTKAFIEFQKSKEYSEYIKAKEGEINKIQSELLSQKSPEAKLLETEISALSKEVYNGN